MTLSAFKNHVWLCSVAAWTLLVLAHAGCGKSGAPSPAFDGPEGRFDDEITRRQAEKSPTPTPTPTPAASSGQSAPITPGTGGATP